MSLPWRCARFNPNPTCVTNQRRHSAKEKLSRVEALVCSGKRPPGPVKVHGSGRRGICALAWGPVGSLGSTEMAALVRSSLLCARHLGGC